MRLDLENISWKEFIVEDVFEVSGTVTTHPSKLIKGGNTPRITTASSNNGLDDFYKNSLTERGGVITVDSATVGYVSYQSADFIATDHVEKITLKDSRRIDRFLGSFLVSSLTRAIAGKYGYGYKFSQSRILKQKVLLPSDSQGNPDYDFMKLYVRQKKQEKLEKYKSFMSYRLSKLKKYKKVLPLEDKNWEEFFIEDIVSIESGRDIYAKERTLGNTPYISSTSNNNGIGYFVGNNNKTEEAGCLSVNRNGSVGYSFYHPYKALFSNDCRKLRLRNASKHVGIFMAQQITRQKGKYGYGYKMGTARLKKQKIMLPVNKGKQPDYEYMGNYMKSVEYKKN